MVEKLEVGAIFHIMDLNHNLQKTLDITYRIYFLHVFESPINFPALNFPVWIPTFRMCYIRAKGGTLSPAFLYKTHSVMPISTSNALIYITDWFPTLLDMAEIPIPTNLNLDGISQKEIFELDNIPAKRFGGEIL